MIQDVRDEAIGRQRQQQIPPARDNGSKLRSHGASTGHLDTPEQEGNELPQDDLWEPSTSPRSHGVRLDPEDPTFVDEQPSPGLQPPAGGPQMRKQRGALKQQSRPLPVVQIALGETDRPRAPRSGLQRSMA